MPGTEDCWHVAFISVKYFLSQSATSHQLRLLRDRGLVAAKRDGRRVIYSLADDHVITLISVGLAHAAHQH
jgi:hypothetical protein